MVQCRKWLSSISRNVRENIVKHGWVIVGLFLFLFLTERRTERERTGRWRCRRHSVQKWRREKWRIVDRAWWSDIKKQGRDRPPALHILLHRTCSPECPRCYCWMFLSTVIASLLVIPAVLFSLLDSMGSVHQSNATASVNLTAPRIKYVALGASDAVGVGTSQPSKDGWVPKFATLVNAEQTFNFGRSGSTLANAMREQLPKALEQKPNLMTIWLAVNDFNQQIFNPAILSSYRSDLNQMLSQLRMKLGSNSRILVGNIPDLAQVSIYSAFGIPKPLLSAQVKQWNDAISDIVVTNQCELVDLYAHWKELAQHPEYISLDGFHPSAHGYTRLADIFYQQYSK